MEKEPDETSGKITLVNWYLKDNHKIEFIWLEDSQITLDVFLILCPYSSEYYQLCQALNAMGLVSPECQAIGGY